MHLDPFTTWHPAGPLAVAHANPLLGGFAFGPRAFGQTSLLLGDVSARIAQQVFGGSRATTTTTTTTGGSVAGSDKQVQYNASGSLSAEAGFEYDAANNQFTAPGVTATQDVLFASIINPVAPLLTQNDWNPTGLATAFAINIVPSGPTTLTGIAGGSTGRLLSIRNIGGNNITFPPFSAGSVSGNQFAFSRNLVLQPLCSVLLCHDGTGWRFLGVTETTVPLNEGGTGADLGSTGGAGQYLKQSSAGGTVTVGTIAAADVPAFTGAGASHTRGGVPDPGATAHANDLYLLRDNGSWHKLAGTLLGVSYVATLETTGNTSPSDLATAQSVAINLNSAADVLVVVSATCRNSSAGGTTQMHVSDGTTTTQISNMACETAGANYQQSGAVQLSLPGSATLTLKFAVNSGTGTFLRRSIAVYRVN